MSCYIYIAKKYTDINNNGFYDKGEPFQEKIAYTETANPLHEKAPPKKPNTKSVRTSKWKLIVNEYDDSKELYKLNVSDLVDGIIKNKKNISHVNFSTILLNNKNFDYKNIWHVDNMHFNSNTHGKLFIKKILDELSKYLIL